MYKVFIIKHQPNSFEIGVLYCTIINRFYDLKMLVIPIHLFCLLIIPKLISTFTVLADNTLSEYIASIFLCLLFDQVIARELRTNPKRSSSVKMTVHILDVNDNQPQFENTSYSAQIAENSPTGTTFTRLQVRHLEFMKTT